MNLLLKIEGVEVEVEKNLDFAITKTFEELQNPTIINNEWSKTITIPMTLSNNRLFGDIFDVERALIANDGSHRNRGLYFNPTKKANFTLYYNSGILMTGYVKLSAVDNVAKCYEINLFGEVGNTFLEMLKCTFNPNVSVDEKYVIPNYLKENLKVTKELIKGSWDNDKPHLLLDDENLTDTDIIGFAPTICGLHDNFEHDTILEANGNFTKIADLINIAKGIDYGDSIIKDGLTERQFGEFRTWNQKPYMYVNKLWQMLVKKSEEICEFPLRLDKVWFNATNPYYRDLIVWLNDVVIEKDTMYNYTNTYNYQVNNRGDFGTNEPDYSKIFSSYFTIDKKYTYEDTSAQIADFKKGTLNIQNRVVIHGDLPLRLSFSDGGWEKNMHFGKNNGCEVNITFADGTPRKYLVVVNDTNVFEKDKNIKPENYDGVVYVADEGKHSGNYFYWDFVIKNLNVNTNHTGNWGLNISMNWLYGNVSPLRHLLTDFSPRLYVISTYTATQLEAKVVTDADTVNIGLLWNPDIAPFDVLLNYAKMYGLIFQVNQKDRCIDVTCRNVYFQDYKILDWTDKVNTANKYKIEQPTFEKKYINFNYDDVDADTYKSYYDKYQIQIGGKRLITEYDFNDDEENLFKGIQPSNVVNQKSYSMLQLLTWKVGNAIEKVENTEVYFDNIQDGKPANIYSAFAFRRKNQPVFNLFPKVRITEDTPEESAVDTYCFHDSTAYDKYSINSDILPYISTIDESGRYGCTFNLPAEINFNPDIMPYDNARFIYDNFWREYIDERYSEQNKKVTLEVNLTPLDFATFQFNHFVKIHNTLYVVNKIKDYGVGNGRNTEVELISINNINGYTAGEVFHYAYFDFNRLDLEGGADFSVNIYADMNWRISIGGGAGEVTVNKKEGKGNDTINVKVKDYTGKLPMVVTPINILNEKEEIIDVLTITQYKKM